MELNELKTLLNDKFTTQSFAKSPEEISLLLRKRTKSIIGGIQRSLWIELIAAAIFSIAFAAVGIYGKYAALKIYFTIFSVLCLLFVPVLYLLLRKTEKLSILPVKNNLETIVKILREYVKRYFQLTLVLIPVTFLVSFSLGYNDANLHNPQLHTPFFMNFEGPVWKTIFWIVYMIAFTLGMYYFTKWYLKKFYGKYISQLESLILELEE